jgi:hypothetical protein
MAMINFFFASRQFLGLTAILPAHIRLTVFFTSRQFTSSGDIIITFETPGDIIIDLASPRRYHHRFGLTQVITSLIWPHHRVPLGGSSFYFISPLCPIEDTVYIQPNGHTILAK